MRRRQAANWCWSAGKYSRVGSAPSLDRPPSANRLLSPKWQVLSAMSSHPEWEKCASTLAWFSRAMVSSDTIISRNAEKVANTPCRPGCQPNPAAAEKLPRSITPPETNRSG